MKTIEFSLNFAILYPTSLVVLFLIVFNLNIIFNFIILSYFRWVILIFDFKFIKMLNWKIFFKCWIDFKTNLKSSENELCSNDF